MRKSFINNICRKFGFEVHGTGYMQALQKNSFQDNAFDSQGSFVKNAAVVFDVGANSGEVAQRYHKMYPTANIYAFEPFPAMYETLCSNTKTSGRVFPQQLAVGAQKGRSSFYVNHNVDTNSLLEPQKTGLSSDKQVANKEQIDVEVISIDEFCQMHSIGKIDILKLDIQGGELAALRGAANMLAAGKVKLIYTEAYFRKQYKNQPLFHDISVYLEQYGYLVQDIYNPIYGNGSVAWCDAIFLPVNQKIH